MIEPYLIKYDLENYPMVDLVGKLLGLTQREMTQLRDDDKPVVDRLHDQDTEWHQKFYRAFQGSLWAPGEYQSFARMMGYRFFGEPPARFCYQTIPTFRVSLPGNLAVGEFHRDTDYNHQAEEVNIWVPVTPAWGSNSIQIEDDSYAVLPGEALIFSGGLLHGNTINTTGCSRVSFDFRIILVSDLRQDGRETLHSHMGFKIGEYWS